MKVIFVIMFVTTIAIAVFYCKSFERVTEEYRELEERYDNLNGKTLTMRTTNLMIKNLVNEYRKDVTHRNACTAMRDISNIMLKNKIELDTDQSN